MMLDRYGPRRVLSVMLLFTAAGTALFAVGESSLTLTMSRVLMGIGCAGGFTGAFYIIAMWLPPDRIVTQTGALNSFAAVGNLFATAPLAALIALIGWRESYWVFTVLILLLTVALAVYVRDTPPDHPPREVKNGEVRRGARGCPRSGSPAGHVAVAADWAADVGVGGDQRRVGRAVPQACTRSRRHPARQRAAVHGARRHRRAFLLWPRGALVQLAQMAGAGRRLLHPDGDRRDGAHARARRCGW